MITDEEKAIEEKKQNVRAVLLIWIVAGILIGVAPLLALNGKYGAVLFITVPFSVGFCAALLKSLKRVHRMGEFLILLLIPALVLFVLFLVFGKEGFICILMAAPFVIGFMTLGLVIGAVVQEKVWAKYLSVIFIFLLNSCTFIYDEKHTEFDISTVQTEIIIHASKEKVWEKLTGRFEFGDADNFFLAHGISYPKEMELKNVNGCNSLFCQYSNGNIAATVDSLVPNELMRFSFHDAPVSMKETSLYSDVEPKHVRGRVRVDYGSFRIIPMENGNVKVIATSQFENNLGPHFYWNWWESYLLNKIHEHVLEKIKVKAEGD